MNEYSGFELGDGKGIDETSGKGVGMREFFERFVGQRKPIVLKGFAQESGWDLGQWAVQELVKRAGDAKIKVEKRTDSSQSFGQSELIDTTFGEFLTFLGNGEQNMYLTAQTDTESQDLLHTPLNQLLDLFPGHPSLLDSLLLHSVNLWVGKSSDGSSSGLHHDYHDNLYVVLKGSKSFHIFSPANVFRLQTNGKPTKVHFNGVINYESYTTRADGALELSANLEDAQLQAELKVQQAEQAVADNETGAQEMLEEAENQLDAILDSYLASSFPLSESDEQDSTDSDTESVLDSKTESTPPLSFCQISSKDAHQICPGAVCSLEVGDALYLPAGWFHEVISKSTENGDDDGIHMAINYWFHPPDSLKDYTFPYKSSYWARRKRNVSECIATNAQAGKKIKLDE